MWSAEEWAIRNAPIARHEPWCQQPERKIPWDYNIKIVPDEERSSFLSAAVTTRSQCNAASGEASRSNQGHNTLLSCTNPMRYVPGVGFIHQQYIHLMRRITTFKTLNDRRRRQFLLHPLPLVNTTSTKARDTIHQQARKNAMQT